MTNSSSAPAPSARLARGVGELPYLPLTPAVTAAVHDAIGVWFDDFPLTPDWVLKTLEQRKKA